MSASTYSDVATRLGFTMQGDHLLSPTYELIGERGGHHVRVCRDTMMSKDLTIDVRLRYPLDLGLTFMSATIATRVQSIVGFFGGHHAMKSGDASLDSAFYFHGDEAERVVSLVRAVRARLVEWPTLGGSFRVSDAYVRGRQLLPLAESAESVCAEVDALVALATAIEHARETVAPALALAPHVPGFRALSERYGLELLTTPLATWGVVGERALSARTWRRGPDVFAIEMALHFPAGTVLPGELWSKGKGENHRTETTGDRAFDERFVVTSQDLLPLLSPEVRRGLRVLAEEAEALTLGDAGLWVRAPLGAAYPVERNADAALAVLRALEASLRGASVYR